MSSHAPGSPPAFPDRRAHLLLVGAMGAFAVYASLLPFHFRPIDPVEAVHRFVAVLSSSATERISRSNYLANVLLFVPIGYGLLGAWALDRRGWRRAAGGIVLLLPVSLALSLSAEFLQEFAPRRVPSRADVVAQTLGCVIGFALWIVAGPAVTAWLRASAVSRRGDRLVRLLTGYAAVWVLASLAPFDVTIDAGDLADRVHRGLITVVPFTSAGRPLARVAWDALITTLSAVPIGALATVWRTPEGRLRRPLPAIGLAAAAFAAVEAAQVFLASHGADVTDVLLGTLGASAGVLLGRRHLPADGGPETTRSTSAAAWRTAGVAAWVVVLALYHWLPWDFTTESAEVRRKLARISLIPFAGYARGSDLAALDTVVVKLALALPLGILLAPSPRQRTPAALALRLLLASAIFGAVEAGQLFVRTRVPDPSDVLVALAGCAAGLAVGGWLQRGTAAR